MGTMIEMRGLLLCKPLKLNIASAGEIMHMLHYDTARCVISRNPKAG